MDQVGDCDAGMPALYIAVTAVVWILTALPLLAWATPCLRRQWSASRIARFSLLIVAFSALCCFVDDVLASMTVGYSYDVDTATSMTYGNQTCWIRRRWAWTPVLRICSNFVVFGIGAFSETWCDVASALSGDVWSRPRVLTTWSRGLTWHAGDHGWGRLIIRTRLTYWWMPLLHFPFALMFSVHDYRGSEALPVFVPQEASDTIVIVWGAWLVFGTFVLSGLACVQCYIARVCLASVDGARSLQFTALINLIQQLFVDFLIVIYAALYVADYNNNPDGGIIAAYHALGFIALWAMHAQVLLLFAVIGNRDPMYNQSEFVQLLRSSKRTDVVPASTVGSPGNRVDNAA